MLFGAVGVDQAQATGAQSLEICAARDQGNVLTRERQFDRHIAADGAHPDYGYFHLGCALTAPQPLLRNAVAIALIES